MSEMVLAHAILVVHLAVIAFNIFGLVAIPLGAWRGWAFVRYPVWRLLHLGSLAVVAVQAAFGQACFLTIWHANIVGETAETPLIMGRVNDLILCPLPIEAFAVAYALVLIHALALFRLVPIRRRRPG